MEIIIRAPSFEEEERRVKKLLEKEAFYKEHGYDVVLPNGDLQKIFDVREYEDGVQKVEEKQERMTQAIQRIEELTLHHDLFLPKTLTIVLTKYGVGGSFDVASARIVLMIRSDGSFAKPVLHLVVHELLHIVTDESYAKRLGLTHGENERFIDLLCRDVFGDLLMNYRMQPIGEGGENEKIKTLVEGVRKGR